MKTDILEATLKPESSQTPIPCVLRNPRGEVHASHSALGEASSAKREAGAAENGSSSHHAPPARPLAPASLPLTPFTLLVNDERFGKLSEADKSTVYGMTRDQLRAVLRLTRLRGIDPAEVLEAMWGRKP